MEDIKDQERILSEMKRLFFTGVQHRTFKSRWHQETQAQPIKPPAPVEGSSISIFASDHPDSRRLFKLLQTQDLANNLCPRNS